MIGDARICANSASRWHHDRSVWAFIGLRFALALAALDLVWEVAHLPLYTIWKDGTPRSIAFAVFHCTLGDVLIGVSALLAALIATVAGQLCDWRWFQVSALTVSFGVGYTAVSEWINTAVRLSWEYSSQMPIVPVVKLGASPLLQSVVVPTVAMWLAYRFRPHPMRQKGKNDDGNQN